MGKRTGRTARAVSVAVALAVLLAACSGGPVRDRASVASATGSPGASVPVRVSVAAGASAGAAAGRTLTVPPGWTATVWADLPDARMMAWTPDHRLLVTSPSAGTLTMFTPTRAGHAPRRTTLVRGLDAPQGIAIRTWHRSTVVVLGEQTRVLAWDWTDGALTDRRIVIDGLPGGGRHPGKFVAVQRNTVAVDIGSSTNRDPVDRTMKPERGTVLQVGLDGSDPQVLAVGARNAEGLAFAPDDTLFAAVNQGDDQPYPFRSGGTYGGTVRSYVDEHPNDQVSRITGGTDLGWPYCVPDSRGRPGLTDLGYVRDPVNNPTGSALDCGAIGRTMLGLPAHSAPIGFAFTTRSALPAPYDDGALITAHGSWDRTPPRAPAVLYSPWDADTRTLGPTTTLIGGFQDADGSRWGRSVDAVPGPGGAIYVSDDQAGLIYRVAPPR